VRISEPFWCLTGLTVILYLAAQTKPLAPEAEIVVTGVSQPHIYS
jgi:hypothetical protein